MKQISNENCEKWSTIHFYSEQQLCGRKPSKPCVNILRRVDALMRWKPIVGKSHETQGINQHNRHRCRAMPVNKRIHRIFIIYWTRENAKKSHRQTHARGGRRAGAVRANLCIIITPPTKFFDIRMPRKCVYRRSVT